MTVQRGGRQTHMGVQPLEFALHAARCRRLEFGQQLQGGLQLTLTTRVILNARAVKHHHRQPIAQHAAPGVQFRDRPGQVADLGLVRGHIGFRPGPPCVYGGCGTSTVQHREFCCKPFG